MTGSGGKPRAVGAFDYIIVGAGSAGCVLANRLSANPATRVLLIEAGPRDSNPWIHVPLGYGRLVRDPSVNWMYSTVPQPELDGREIFQPRGKVLGGSSSINGLLYIRGQKEDFDDWQRLGATGWGWDDVLPYFIRAEHQERGASAYHGVGGPLPVSDQRDTHGLCDAFIDAAAQRGHSRNTDFNGPTQQGAGYYQTTSRNGRRISSAAAYLKPARNRPNLHIVTGALVSRIVFEGRTATGVEWTRGDIREGARAAGEVILASGAINSPQLLQLSGVGAPDLLGRHGIPVVVAVPEVGQNLLDHLQVRCIYRSKTPNTINDELRSWHGKLAVGLRYVLQRRGPLAVSAGSAGGFFRSEMSPDRPDIQAHFIRFSTDRMGDRLHRFSGFTVSSCQLRPESRGMVAIASSDHRAPPLIDPRYFTAEGDRRAHVAGISLLRAIMREGPIADMVAEEVEPGVAIRDDDEILAYCRRHASTLYHPVGTARMGADDRAVVDPRLRLRGVDRLRVVDGSVMPSLLSGNTHAGIVMIAEKASDMIIADAQTRDTAGKPIP